MNSLCLLSYLPAKLACSLLATLIREGGDRCGPDGREEWRVMEVAFSVRRRKPGYQETALGLLAGQPFANC